MAKTKDNQEAGINSSKFCDGGVCGEDGQPKRSKPGRGYTGNQRGPKGKKGEGGGNVPPRVEMSGGQK